MLQKEVDLCSKKTDAPKKGMLQKIVAPKRWMLPNKTECSKKTDAAKECSKKTDAPKKDAPKKRML